jgi:hypothetical protein
VAIGDCCRQGPLIKAGVELEGMESQTLPSQTAFHGHEDVAKLLLEARAGLESSLRSEDGIVKVRLLNHSRNMVLRVQPADVPI